MRKLFRTVIVTDIADITENNTQYCVLSSSDNTKGSLYFRDKQGNIIEVAGGGGSQGMYFEVTKSNMDNLINNSQLIPNALYKITGVNPDLYDDGSFSGTNIFLKALSTNQLSKNGHGEFWNPFYNKATDGFGIWNNQGSFTTYLPSSLGNNPNTILFNYLDSKIYSAGFGSNGIVSIFPGNNGLLSDMQPGTWGMAYDSVGNLFATSFFYDKLYKITPDGNATVFYNLPNNSGCHSIIIDSADNIFLAYAYTNKIVKITSAGVVSNYGDGIAGGNLYQLCFGVTQDIIYGANQGSNSIIKFDGITTQSIIWDMASPDGSGFRDVKFDSNTGDLWAVAGGTDLTTGSCAIYKLSDDGAVMERKDSLFQGDGSLIIDNESNIYVHGRSVNYIVKYDSAFNKTTINFPDPSVIEGVLCGTIDIDTGRVFFIAQDMKVYVLEDNVIQFYAEGLYHPNLVQNENITSDNGATGILLTSPIDGEIASFQVISGDWLSSSQITGETSGITASIGGVTALNVNIGSFCIWGGYSWTNLTGEVGEMINSVQLDPTNWGKDPYTEDNYNKVLDIIEYDYDNDLITRRYEVEFSNDVIFNYADNQSFGVNAISLFQFGNGYDNDQGKGIGNILVKNSVFDNINFIGQLQTNITLNGAQQLGCNYALNCRQMNLNFESNASQQTITFEKNTSQEFMSFRIGSSSADFTIPSGYFMTNIENYGIIESVSLTDSSILLQGFHKTVYKRPDGTSKIRYYNDDDQLVIADIEDDIE